MAVFYHYLYRLLQWERNILTSDEKIAFKGEQYIFPSTWMAGSVLVHSGKLLKENHRFNRYFFTHKSSSFLNNTFLDCGKQAK